jgi:GR25 family glycosyltransferase involved in LPS biosynthesis
MKSYVITIKSLSKSVKAAERMIASAPEYDVQMFNAITPKDNPLKLFAHHGLPTNFFAEEGSHRANCMSAFLSHFTLWQMCVRDNVEYQIFEHDAVAVAPIPKFISYTGAINLGAPSYGKQKQCAQLGVNPLTTKTYFPGAHAYRIKPAAAKAFISIAMEYARPTDVFLHIEIFPWLQEFYPHPVVARDTFTTIQKEGGCVAKHNYNANKYEIIADVD